MTREQCEARIFEKLVEIDKIQKEYNPNADYLSLTIWSKNQAYRFNNSYWKAKNDEEAGEDVDYPLDFTFYKEDNENEEN